MEDRAFLETKEGIKELKRQLDNSRSNQEKSVARIRQRLNALRSLAAKMEEEVKDGKPDKPST